MNWNQLEILSIAKQKPREAEEWFRKTVSYFKDMEDKTSASKAINNLATVLEKFPESLNEAKQLAEDALNIQQNIDPVASEIWLTYDTLAKISDKQGNSAKAKEYRQLSRSSRANFAGTQNKLQRFADVIVMAVMAVYESETRKQLEIYMQEAPPQWQNLIVATRQILNGQRDEDILCTGLDIEDSQVVLAILRGISDPETLQSFLK
jgi:tetratricopeptide (TPR) repeat protein